MAGEIKIEKPTFETIKPELNKVEKISSSENKVERILPVAQKKIEIPAKPIEKKDAGNFTLSPVASDWQKKQEAAIDSILSEGLGEVFLKMKPEEQKVFQKEGEETVTKISKLLNSTKVKINKIVALIRKWLSLVTGINKFFLEQEVKIKADKILRLKDKR
jgi:hypothetical protein